MDTEEFIRKYSWMVRPCSLYQEEYSDCTSLRGRIHQYFVSGELADCSHWKESEKDCERWKEEGDAESLERVVRREATRKAERLAAHGANDVWAPRDEPPRSWNSPLPEPLVQRQASSYLVARAKEAKSGQPSIDETRYCTVS